MNPFRSEDPSWGNTQWQLPGQPQQPQAPAPQPTWANFNQILQGFNAMGETLQQSQELNMLTAQAMHMIMEQLAHIGNSAAPLPQILKLSAKLSKIILATLTSLEMPTTNFSSLTRLAPPLPMLLDINWSEQTKISNFYRNLKTTVKDTIAMIRSQDRLTRFKNYVDFVIEINNWVHLCAQE
ncbi:hypothetical protein DXG03_009559 [Asterophora parasitica]|uniref:Uncharacterized protein n=1 Tax=Asterophora parasitica TaxID=117018 RepID=A0A9P7K8N3_9AGAR|nr:hypothetical protein DXG03_009559 [Asterophora parasitica]